MITKKKLLAGLDDLAHLETGLVSLLNRHLYSALPFSNLGEIERTELQSYFQRQALLQTKSLETLGSLRSEIAKGSTDVY